MTRVLTVPGGTARANVVGSSAGDADALPVKTFWKQSSDRDFQGLRKRRLDAFRRSHQRAGNRLPTDPEGRGDAGKRKAAQLQLIRSQARRSAGFFGGVKVVVSVVMPIVINDFSCNST